MNINHVKKQLEEKKIIAIYRQKYGDTLRNIANAVRSGGVRFIEVTFDQADPDCILKTAQAIEMLCHEFPDMHIGAGTVMNCAQVDAAVNAGAKYIISPNTDIEVIKYTKQNELISIPGAMTPSEIASASNAGADYVKLFPCAYLGEKYVKDIMAPLNHVKLIATGGITVQNLPSFLSLGMVGAGISGSLSDKNAILNGDWNVIEEAARQFSNIAALYNK